MMPREFKATEPKARIPGEHRVVPVDPQPHGVGPTHLELVVLHPTLAVGAHAQHLVESALPRRELRVEPCELIQGVCAREQGAGEVLGEAVGHVAEREVHALGVGRGGEARATAAYTMMAGRSRGVGTGQHEG